MLFQQGCKKRNKSKVIDIYNVKKMFFFFFFFSSALAPKQHVKAK